MSEENRRPIQARSLQVIRTAASFLAKSKVTPNQISLLSILFSLVVPGAILAWGVGWLGCLVALLGIQLRLLCNLLDGMVAIEGGKRSIYGDIFNEFPDRISDTIILVGFTYCVRGNLFVYSLGWAACFLAVLTAYTRVLGASLGTRHYFVGPMAKQQRMALVSGVLVALPLAGHFAEPLVVAALLVIVVGSVMTCAKRLSLIAIELNSSKRT